MSSAGGVVVLAPNWLGDAVMLLPALAAIRQWTGDGRLTVAARPAIAPFFTLVPRVDEVLALGGRDEAGLRGRGFETAILFPNSFHAAWTARRARIPERWGFAADLRGPLLTRAVPRPRRRLHQAEYYLALTSALGMSDAPLMASIEVSAVLREQARALLRQQGWRGGPVVAFAPGAAYGAAKRWPPERVGAVAAQLARRHGATPVVLGSGGDAAAAREAARAYTQAPHTGDAPPIVDLTGRTDLPLLAAVLAEAAAVVSNDSGAMHVAAAVGAPLAAIFGPTDETATAPLPHPSKAPSAVIVGEAWCRPCGLRSCPIDHRCMTSIGVDRVSAEAERLLAARPPARASGGTA